jgi:proliferating cell nuclear antigen
MFIASFDNGGEILKKIIDICKDDIAEAVLVVSPTGISLQSLDNAHVSLVDIFIDPNIADIFECDETFELGFSLTIMNKIFKCSSSSGTCTLNYDDEDAPDILLITFTNGTEDKSATFEMKLMTIDVDPLMIPDQEDLCEQYIIAKDLQRIVKDLAVFGEDVCITRTGKNLGFSSRGDGANVNIQMTIEDNYNGSISETFAVKYLQWFCKASTLCDEVLLAIDPNPQRPLAMLKFEQEDLFNVRFFLSAKIPESLS